MFPRRPWNNNLPNDKKSADSNQTSPGTEPGEEIQAEVLAVDGRPVYQLDTTPPGAIVIHCGDPRFQTAFRRFITEELGYRTYIPVVLGGGVHALGAQVFFPKNFKVLWQQVKFMREQFDITDIILINHEDCRWYEKMSGFHPTIDARTKGKHDLVDAAKLLLQDFGHVRVRSYWAEIEGEKVMFREVG